VRLLTVLALLLLLLPRLRTQDVMHILNLLVPPNLVVHTGPPQRLERVVDIRQRYPAPAEQVAQQRLVGKVVGARGLARELLEDEVVDGQRRVHDLQTAIGYAEPDGRGRAVGLRGVRRVVLRGEGAIGRHPTQSRVSLYREGSGVRRHVMGCDATYQSVG